MSSDVRLVPQGRPRGRRGGGVQPRHAAAVLRAAAAVLPALGGLRARALAAPEHPLGLPEHRAARAPLPRRRGRAAPVSALILLLDY